MDKLTAAQILDASLDDWRQLATALHGRFTTGDFATGMRFVAALGAAAEQADHHPDVTLTYPWVDVKLSSHDAHGITQRDVDLARAISAIAAGLGVAATPEAVSEIELGLDAASVSAIGPFWAALLTGTTDTLTGNDVIDPTQRVPLLWFQDTDAHETPRQRFHIDLWVPHDVADARIAAAVAAGGTVVDASAAPSFTVVADSDGNRACVCTSLER